jgi:CheY-like chemotaxis protein
MRLPLASRTGRPQLGSRPLEIEKKKLIEHKPTGNGPLLDGVRVLVMVDDSDTLDVVRLVLDERGAAITTAASASEALEVLARWRPHVLVTDVGMPDQAGYKLIEQVRSQRPEQGGNVAAVAITSYARAEDRVRPLIAGFQMHLPKPVDPEELAAVVAALTGRLHSRSA